MKKNIFEFISVEPANPDIEPMKKFIPDWYKNIKGFTNKNIMFEEGSFVPVKTAKNCLPFLDSLTAGYSIPLWKDVYVESIDQNTQNLKWNLAPAPIEVRKVNEYNSGIPIPDGFSITSYAWKLPYIIKAPKGYSALITHPLNRYDLPFITLSGIIDLDEGMYNGNIPFFINGNFTGVIDQGTPIAQIIPFKREDWKIEKNKDLLDIGMDISIKSASKFFGWYKNNLWKMKKYE